MTFYKYTDKEDDIKKIKERCTFEVFKNGVPVGCGCTNVYGYTKQLSRKQLFGAKRVFEKMPLCEEHFKYAVGASLKGASIVNKKYFKKDGSIA